MKKTVPLKKPVYLDNAAATPMDPRVIQAMTSCLAFEGTFGNSSSKDHVYGWNAAEAVEKARDQIASSIGCSPLEIIFTSGATESNNLALRGLAYGLRKKGDKRNHIITSTIEHKAVLECCAMLEEEGFTVTYLKPHTDGSITPDQVEAALRPETFLVSISQANSVLGTVNDLNALASVTRAHDVYYHSDCAQSNALLDLDLDHSPASLITLTPEKIYGPKGCGALYVEHDLDIPLQPLIVGGGHEKGLRGGTLATHQIAAMGEAFALMHKERQQVISSVSALRDRLIAGLLQIEGCSINGSTSSHLPGIVSASFKGINGALLLPSLRQVACSSGSACSSKELKPSYVLTEIGLSDDDARASLRLSIGRFNTKQDIDDAIAALQALIPSLHK